MAKLQLIITADYEIFGNGSGCADHCMIAPTERMMKLAEAQGGSICLFVDVCEYWAFQQAYGSGQLAEDEAAKIEQQLKDAVRRGHDVQLHFHPQWLDAQFENGKWHLNEAYWRLPEVERLAGWSLEKLFREGKATLESMLRPVDPNYACDVFRAGAWCIQPEEEVLRVMKNLGFRIESTVAPGKIYFDGRTVYDFTQAPNLPFWKISGQVTQDDPEGTITEYPIFTTHIPGWQVFRFNLIKAMRNIPQKPVGCEAVSDSRYTKSFIDKFFGSFEGQVKMLNNSDGVSFQEMQFITKKAIRRYRNHPGNVPLVMIGHPKTFGNDREFERYLAWITTLQDVKFGNYKN
ncbi:MAG: hypothetical protein KDD41_08065 [Flavobacteriales bacterium]|nr:hypothetical protein [Flavobacteriales bacterium]